MFSETQQTPSLPSSCHPRNILSMSVIWKPSRKHYNISLLSSVSTLWGCTLLSSLSSSAGNQAAFSLFSRVTPQALVPMVIMVLFTKSWLTWEGPRRVSRGWTSRSEGQWWCTPTRARPSEQGCRWWRPKPAKNIILLSRWQLSSEFYLIGEVTKDHLCKEGHEDGCHDGGWDILPTEAEEQPRPAARHQLNVLGEPLEAVEVSHPETLEQRDHQQGDGAAEVVVDGEGVVAGVVTKHQRHDTEKQTDGAWEQRGNLWVETFLR